MPVYNERDTIEFARATNPGWDESIDRLAEAIASAFPQVFAPHLQRHKA